MAIQGVHHVSFTVSDLERSVDFYCRLLGFQLVGCKHRQAPDLGDALRGPRALRPPEAHSSAPEVQQPLPQAQPSAAGVEQPAQRAELRVQGPELPAQGAERPTQPADILIADLELAGTRLELIQYVDPTTRPYHGDPSVAGSGHLALLTDDIEREIQRLRAAGVRFHGPARTICDPGRPVWRWCYFRDPDGICVELVQSGDRAEG